MIVAKSNPRRYQLRKVIASWLIRLGRKIDPKSDDWMAYFMDEMMKANVDSLIRGRGGVMIKHVPLGDLPDEAEEAP